MHYEGAASFLFCFLWLDQATKAGAYNNRPVFVAFFIACDVTTFKNWNICKMIHIGVEKVRANIAGCAGICSA